MYTTDDLAWLAQNYPSLSHSAGVITGRLRYSMLYDPSDKSCTLNPSPSDRLKTGIIYHADDYSVEIEWDQRRGYPVCYVTDDKIKGVATSRGMPLVDIHMYTNGALCVATPQELDLSVEAGFSLQSFMVRYLIPYLFLQTHFRKNNEWVWEPESHGISGIVGWYYLHRGDYDTNKLVELTIKHVATYISVEMRDALLLRLRHGAYKGHMPCLCGSVDKRMRDCCPRALYGLNELRKVLIALLIELQQRDKTRS